MLTSTLTCMPLHGTVAWLISETFFLPYESRLAYV